MHLSLYLWLTLLVPNLLPLGKREKFSTDTQILFSFFLSFSFLFVKTQILNLWSSTSRWKEKFYGPSPINNFWQYLKFYYEDYWNAIICWEIFEYLQRIAGYYSYHYYYYFFTYHYFNTHLDPTHHWPQPSSSLWPQGTLQNIKKEKKSPYPKLRLRKSELPLVTSCMNNDLRQKSHRLVCVDCYLKTPNFSESFINIKSNLKGCFLEGWTEVFSLQEIHISLFYLIYVMDNIPTGSLQKALTSIPLWFFK